MMTCDMFIDNEKRFSQALEFWQNTLGDLQQSSQLDLSAMLPFSDTHFSEKLLWKLPTLPEHINKTECFIDYNLINKINKLSLDINVSVDDIFLGALAWLLYKYSGMSISFFGCIRKDVVPVIMDFTDRDLSVSEWLQTLSTYISEAEHAAFVGSDAIHKVSGVPIDQPLFDVLICFGNKDQQVFDKHHSLMINVDLANTDDEDSTYPRISVSAGSSLGQAGITQFISDFYRLLQGFSRSHWSLLKDVSLEPFVSKELAGDPTPLCELFVSSSRQHTDAIALQSGDLSFTYHQLYLRAGAIQQMFFAKGLKEGDRIGLHLQRQSDMLATIIACLFSGITFVPLDPLFPAQRLLSIQSEADLTAVLSDIPQLDSVIFSCPVLSPPAQTIIADDVLMTTSFSTNLPAYMMFTSGSTGKPKGVVISHQALATFLTAINKRIGLDSGSCCLAVTTLAFDISLLELLAPLLSGGCIVLADTKTSKDPVAIAEYLQSNTQINLFQATPTFWRMLFKAGWRGRDNLKALCGGEALDTKLAEQILENTQELWHCYGPTEATVWSLIAKLEPVEGAAITLKGALDGYDHLVLDDDDHAVSSGMVGELCITGNGLANGYWNRPDLNSTRFVNWGDNGLRLYRTGDRVRVLGNDSYQYLGRMDDQVKLRGFRIELGEIEAHLKSLPQIHQAAVVLQGAGEEACLVGFIEIVPGYNFSRLAIRKALQKLMPGYMVPTRFIVMDKLPTTGSEKIDRNHLLSLNSAR